MKKTLIIVDHKHDFLEGGALAVRGADKEFVKAVERIRPLFDQVILTADWHPADHVSFSVFPPHRVAGTHGAQLAVASGDLTLLKGQAKDSEEFSAFGSGKHVQSIEGDDVYVIGLAGDYCVKQTLFDLLEFAPQKRLFAIKDLIRSVDGTAYGPVDHFFGKVPFVTSSELS